MIILTEGPKDPKHKRAIDAILKTAKDWRAPVTMHSSDKDVGFKFNSGENADTVYMMVKNNRNIEDGWRLEHRPGDVWIGYDDDRRED